jgi:hypothetical protein
MLSLAPSFAKELLKLARASLAEKRKLYAKTS